MRVLVCGGRDYGNKSRVFEVLTRLDAMRRFSLLITGACPTGADAIAEEWAEDWVSVRTYPAQWEKYGKKAGPMRNEAMLQLGKPDLVVAFPGGRGTADMVRRAKAAGIEVIEVSP